MGAWIETFFGKASGKLGQVAPYVGAWIETQDSANRTNILMSHPMWVRGLKHRSSRQRVFARKVAPYVGAWIETRGLSLV